MIEQKAKVVGFNNDTVFLDVERQSTCSACEVRQGCGTGLLSKHVGKRFSHIKIHKKNDVKIGQQVQVAISEKTLLQGAFLVYLIPILLLFVFSAIAQVFNFSEMVEILFGVTGLILGFYFVKIRLNNNNDFQAGIVEEKNEKL
jgi:sigma-E factor negative regulatory protein RseC